MSKEVWVSRGTDYLVNRDEALNVQVENPSNLWTCAGAVNGLDCKSNVHQFDSDHVLNKIKE